MVKHDLVGLAAKYHDRCLEKLKVKELSPEEKKKNLEEKH